MRTLLTATLIAAALVGVAPSAATAATGAAACATPCTWTSPQKPTRIEALKAAEARAKTLHDLGYTILSVTTRQIVLTAYTGVVKYQGDA
ncbi:hypothetical protein ACU635_35180 [[Actinomadura] parvosata]|uniref:hypothetical protein n=1 Tax=[Actinomadura] parvosata TaxID=1955412 RepID=UPI00406CC88D